jgi:hypothetical protein
MGVRQHRRSIVYFVFLAAHHATLQIQKTLTCPQSSSHFFGIGLVPHPFSY